MRIGILEPYNFSARALSLLRHRGDVSSFDGENLDSFIHDKDILFARLKYYLGPTFFEKAKRLKVICSPTTGLNHIDMNETDRKGIKILSLKGQRNFLMNIRATPEHAFGLIIALLRNYKDAFLNSRNRIWDREKFIGREIYKNTFGIIGLGRVGILLAKYLTAFEGKVFFYDKKKAIPVPAGVKRARSLPDLVRRSNVIVLCAAYEGERVIDKKMIDLMKDRYFVNIARGELVDERYLISKIKQGHFRGAALDVITDEMRQNDLSKLLPLAEKFNLIITPHIGGATVDSMQKTEEWMAHWLIESLKG